MLVRAKRNGLPVSLPFTSDVIEPDTVASVPSSMALYLCLMGLVTLEAYEEGDTVSLIQPNGDPVAQGGDGDAAKVVLPSQVSGQIARYHIAAQSNSRTRIELPTGAKAIRIGYFARKTDGASTADGEILKVVFNISGTTEAGNALSESAMSPGGTVAGVSYLTIPIDSVYEAAFPDPDDRLYYVDFLTLTAEAGESDVVIEVTL